MEKNINKTAVEQNEKQRYYMQEVRKIVQKKSQELGRPLFCCTTTFGCQMNAHDSEKILGMLKEMGYVEVKDEKSADFIIYNTCCVREKPRQEIYSYEEQKIERPKSNNTKITKQITTTISKKIEKKNVNKNNYKPNNIYEIQEFQKPQKNGKTPPILPISRPSQIPMPP